MRLLAAVDVYSDAEPTVAMTVPWARRFGATVDLAYASVFATEGLHPPAYPSDELDALWGQWAASAREERARLDALLERVPTEIRGQAHLLAGPAGQALADAATGFDLLTVATHRRSGLARLISGSVAARAVRTCPVPLLGLAADDPLPAEPLRVLAPLEEDSAALGWIAKHLPGAAVEVVHVRSNLPTWVAGPPRNVLMPPPVSALQAELEMHAANAGFPRAPIHLLPPQANPADALVQAAQGLGVHLVVMPTHGLRGLARAFLGSVTERVIAHATCAVLAVPWALREG